MGDDRIGGLLVRDWVEMFWAVYEMVIKDKKFQCLRFKSWPDGEAWLQQPNLVLEAVSVMRNHAIDTLTPKR